MKLTKAQARSIITKLVHDGLGDSTWRDQFPQAWLELSLFYHHDMADHLYELVPAVTRKRKKKK